jgi:hypothetical protein
VGYRRRRRSLRVAGCLEFAGTRFRGLPGKVSPAVALEAAEKLGFQVKS